MSVNDAFVLKEWAESLGAGDAITMLADGNGDFTKARACSAGPRLLASRLPTRPPVCLPARLPPPLRLHALQFATSLKSPLTCLIAPPPRQQAMGLELDGRGFGLGTRSLRYAAVIEDGVVRALAWPGRCCPRCSALCHALDCPALRFADPRLDPPRCAARCHALGCPSLRSADPLVDPPQQPKAL